MQAKRLQVQWRQWVVGTHRKYASRWHALQPQLGLHQRLRAHETTRVQFDVFHMSLTAFLSWTYDVMTLRASPADAPASHALFGQLIFLTLLASLLHLEIIGEDYDPLVVIARLALNLGLLYAVLWLFGFAERFQQTVIASCAVSIAITLIALPIRQALLGNEGSMDLGVQFLQLGLLGLFIWTFVIDAHILRHALQIGFWLAFALAFSLVVIHESIAGWLLG